MAQGTIANESRWVFRILWFMAAALAISILTVRSNGILDQSHQMLVKFKEAGSSAFTAPLAKRNVPESLDSIAWTDHSAVAIRPGAAIRVGAGSVLTVSGWAFDPQSGAPFIGLGAQVDQRTQTFAGVVRRARPDVAATLHDPRATDSGFNIDIDTADLPLGHHIAMLRALAPDGRSAVALGAIPFVIQRRALGAQTTDSIDAINGVIINGAASRAAPIGILHSAIVLDVYGWAFITDGQRLANSVSIVIDGNAVGPARYGLTRADVARAYHDVRVTRCGIDGSINLSSLTPGVHEIQFRLSLSDGTEIDSASAVRINLE